MFRENNFAHNGEQLANEMIFAGFSVLPLRPEHSSCDPDTLKTLQKRLRSLSMFGMNLPAQDTKPFQPV